MLVLALEQSAVLCSAAVLREDEVLAQMQWEAATYRNQQVFELLPSLCRSAGCGLSDLELFAVGTGPGAFSALRIASAALAGIAAPGGRPVLGVPSTEAIAHELWLAHRVSPLLVVGDARRGRFWCALYSGVDDAVRCIVPPALCTPEEIAPLLKDGGMAATSDWSRLADTLPPLLPPAARLIRENCIPGAATVGRLALQRIRLPPPWAPPTPLYLTPPTSVPPRPQG